MRRVGGWLSAGKNASTQSLSALDEPQALREAMAGTAHILNDDVETAQFELSKGTSPFHKLGLGVVTFLQATLGFEQEMMREANEHLSAAETAATDHHRRAHRDAYQSAIYPVGAEYSLCHAESQLMSAVLAVLNESLTESIRGFYKLRRAYATLQEIADAETRYLAGKSRTSIGTGTLSRHSIDSNKHRVGKANGASARRSVESLSSASPGNGSARIPVAQQARDEEDDEPDFVDAEEMLAERSASQQYQGHLDLGGASSRMAAMTLDSAHSNVPKGHSRHTTNTSAITAPEGEYENVDDFFTHPIDAFIHSGSSLCFGILQLMLSLVPPSFSKLLSIVGFRGDRQAGIEMLWRATHYDNINGAMAGLVLLGFYNVVGASVDILRADAYPKARCRVLLGEMREKYPKSRLWLLEESRMIAGDKKLEQAVELTGQKIKSPLKQVEALQWFEHSLNCMYLHRYEESAESFVKCVSLNNWSHGLYYFIAGACYIELYRQHRTTSPKKAQKFADSATELIRKIATLPQKRRFMSRPLPFDAFVARKISKWEARAAAHSLSLVDAAGVSPVEEMIFFWNGHKRMRAEQMRDSLRALAWSEGEGRDVGVGWRHEGPDEKCVLHVLRAAVYRGIGETGRAKEVLSSEVLVHEWSTWRGVKDVDNWTLPAAHYEMAVCLWIEADGGGEAVTGIGAEERDEKIRQCAVYVDKVAKWDAFDLDTRIGLKVRTAQDTLRKMGVTV